MNRQPTEIGPDQFLAHGRIQEERRHIPIDVDVLPVQQPGADDLTAILIMVDDATMDVPSLTPPSGEHVDDGIQGYLCLFGEVIDLPDAFRSATSVLRVHSRDDTWVHRQTSC